MDPVTGIGLTAAVVQLVHFSGKAIELCREIHERGSSTALENAGDMAQRLAKCADSVQESLNAPVEPSKELSEEDKELLDIARKCKECALKLNKKVLSLRVPPNASRRDIVPKTLNILRKKGKVDELQRDLERNRSMLETSMLTSLRYGRSRAIITFALAGIQWNKNRADLSS